MLQYIPNWISDCYNRSENTFIVPRFYFPLNGFHNYEQIKSLNNSISGSIVFIEPHRYFNGELKRIYKLEIKFEIMLKVEFYFYSHDHFYVSDACLQLTNNVGVQWFHICCRYLNENNLGTRVMLYVNTWTVISII